MWDLPLSPFLSELLALFLSLLSSAPRTWLPSPAETPAQGCRVHFQSPCVSSLTQELWPSLGQISVTLGQKCYPEQPTPALVRWTPFTHLEPKPRAGLENAPQTCQWQRCPWQSCPSVAPAQWHLFQHGCNPQHLWPSTLAGSGSGSDLLKGS